MAFAIGSRKLCFGRLAGNVPTVLTNQIFRECSLGKAGVDTIDIPDVQSRIDEEKAFRDALQNAPIFRFGSLGAAALFQFAEPQLFAHLLHFEVGANARHEFTRRERFHQIVVGPSRCLPRATLPRRAPTA